MPTGGFPINRNKLPPHIEDVLKKRYTYGAAFTVTRAARGITAITTAISLDIILKSRYEKPSTDTKRLGGL